MSKDWPLVTIGIPVFNGAEFILHALSSVANQTYENIEVIIIDDASTDGSADICDKWANDFNKKVRLYRHEVNKGLPASCNSIVCKANGKYIQLLDHDDILLPQKIDEDVAFLEHQNTDVAFVYSKVELINASGKKIDEDYFTRMQFTGPINEPSFFNVVENNFIPGPSVMIRTTCIKAVGGYDESLKYQDWDMWLKLTKKFRALYRDVCNVQYRIHEKSMLGSKTQQQAIKINALNILMLENYLGESDTADQKIMNKLRELVIYSYYKADPGARVKLWHYLKKKFDFKVAFYLLLASLGVGHPARLKK